VAADFVLTPKEQAFLREHPVWRMAGAASPPFQWLDEEKQLHGLSQDFRMVIERKLGIRLEPVPAETWDESLEQLRRKECDLSLMTSETPERGVFLIFTEPLLDLPLAVIARRDHSPVKEVGELAGQRVAIARHWPIHEKLLAEHPEILLVPRDDVGSAISAVALGDAEAYIGDLASATDAIDRLGVTNLQVAGHTRYVFPFRIGVRKDWPEAVALLNRVIASIPPDEHLAIRRKWIKVDFPAWPLRRVLIYAVPSAVALVALTLLLVNQRLAQEVAHRKRSEGALRESEERWSFALEGSREGVWDLNVATNGVFFSRQCKRILELDEGEIEERIEAWTSRIHPEDRLAMEEAMRRYLWGQVPTFELEHRLRTKAGSFRWILARGCVVARDEAGQPLRMVGTHTDITERKESDLAVQIRLEETVRARTEELERAERNLRQITDNIPGAVYQFVKKMDGSFAFAFCSEGMESMVGVSPDDAVRDVNTVWAVIHPEDLAELVEKANHSAETLTGYVQDLRIQQPDGRMWWIQAEAAPQRQPDGSTVWNGNIMDISERKRLEGALAEAKQVADSANRAKSVFLANMSHEIRTPMNAILGFSQLLARDSGLNPVQRHHMETITRSGEHLLALINDILEISKIEAGRVGLNFSSFEVGGLLDDLDRMFRMRAEAKGLSLAIECDGTVPPMIKSDESKLRQILINLLGNAVKFTERGGVVVRLSAGRGQDGKLRLRGEVEDSGPGIETADLPKLFEQFEQTETGRRAGVGTGLGLAISREFIRLLGGEIEVVSKEGWGTTFRFDLLVEEGTTAVRVKAGRGRVLRLRPAHVGMRVLIADDKAENRELLEHLLLPVGFEVRSVEDGATAVEVFSEWRPQIGLLDLRMPGLDGFAAIRSIRQLPGGAQVPIIAVTASAFEEDRRDVIAAGGNDFLGKPFRERELFEKIGRLTGAEFEYEDEPAAPLSPADRATPLTVEQVAAAIPSDLRARLAQAALRADFDEMLAVLAQAETVAPEIARELSRRVEGFEYQALLDLLQATTLSA
jgi:two-component system sensor histidine kinase/response regulator